MLRVASTVVVAMAVAFAVIAAMPAAPGQDDLRSLSLAIRQGNLAAVQALVAKTPAFATAADDGGYTPLHIAATAGSVEIIEFLLKHGAAIEARTGGGQTPLFQTVPLANEEAFRFLRSKGADINARDNDGRTILQFALRWQRPTMIDLILSTGSSIQADGAAARDMLEEAANTGMETLVTALVAKGVAAGPELRNGSTLLHSAETSADFAVPGGPRRSTCCRARRAVIIASMMASLSRNCWRRFSRTRSSATR